MQGVFALRGSIVVAACLLAGEAFAAPFTSGTLVVLQVGDGSAALSSSATPVFLREYTRAGALLQTISFPASGSSPLTLSGTATTDGQLTLSSDKFILTFAGYAAAAGTGSPVGSTTINRAVGVVTGDGICSRTAVSSNAFSGANFRGVASNGKDYWLAGDSTGTGDPDGGVWYSAGGGVPLQIRSGNLRAVNIFSNRLYASSTAATGPYGIHGFTNLPVSAQDSAVLLDATNGVGTTSPSDFAFSPGGTLAYVTDDRAAADGGGIQRWTNNGAGWGLAYTLTPGGSDTTNTLRQLTVDFSGTNPVLFATTSEASANRLISITDTGALAGASYTVLAAAATNTVFRGVEFSPISRPAQRVLFLGDSLLGISSQYSNNVPATLAELAANLGDAFTYTRVAQSGWLLADHATNSLSTNLVNSGSFDLVVLQEKSQPPSLPSQREGTMFPACRQLNTLAANNNERTMFYQTWGQINGDPNSLCNTYDIPPQYRVCNYPSLDSFFSMNIAVRKAYTMIAGELGAAIAPVGLAWGRVRVEKPGLNLFILDDSLGDRHPNCDGAYLAACVFYCAIFGRSPEGATYYSTNLPVDAVYLQRVAAETVLGDPFAADAYGLGTNGYYWAYRWQDFTNSASVTISGASARPSPSVRLDSVVTNVSNITLGVLDAGQNVQGQGRLYVREGASLTVTGSVVVGQSGKGFVRQTGGSLEIGGELLLAEQGMASGQYTLSNGTLRAGRILRGAGTAQFAFQGGQLGFGQFGSSASLFDLACGGGTLTISNLTGPVLIYGNYSQSNSATLSVELGAISNSLVVNSGAAVLSGALKLSFASGFEPATGQRFTLLSAPAITGSFSQTNLPPVTSGGVGLVVSQSPNAIVAEAVSFTPWLSAPGLSSNREAQFTVSGVAGYRYVVQSRTNLSSGSWMPVLTNTAPFVFTGSNTAAAPSRFYRAIVAP